MLTFNNFDIVDEIIQHAIKAEDIAYYQARKFFASKRAMHTTSSLHDSKLSGLSEKFSPSPKVRIGSPAFIVNNRGIAHWNF